MRDRLRTWAGQVFGRNSQRKKPGKRNFIPCIEVLEDRYVPAGPSAPTNLVAAAGNDQVALTWNASSGATSYDIYRGTSSGSETLLQTGVSGNNFNDLGVVSGSTFFYEVTAVNANGQSGDSNEASATLAPAAPTNLKAIVFATTAGNVSVALTWNASSGATSYDIYRGTSSGKETLLQTGVSGTSFIDSSETSGSTYYYQVTAVDAGGPSGVSNESSAIMPPAAPSNLTATAGNVSIALTWKASSGAASYDIYRGTSSGTETLLQTGVTATSFIDTSLTSVSTYFYEVTAVNTGGQSAVSNESSATLSSALLPPAAPTNFSATVSNGKVYLAWNSSSGATDYDIYRGTSSGNETFLASVTAGTLYYTDSSGDIGNTYFYDVTAVNTIGQSAASNETSATLPPAPTLTATPGNGQITLTWSASSAAAGYEIYRGTSSGNLTLLQGGVTGTSYTDASVTNGDTYYYEVIAVNASVSNFQGIPLTTQYTNGESYNEDAGPSGYFVSGGNYFNNSYFPAYGGYWFGWSVSNTTDTTTPNYINQFSAITGSGPNGASTYAVAFASCSATDPFHPNASIINLAAGTNPASIQVTNTTYAYLSMLDGDSSEPAFGPSDYFLLTINGYTGPNGTGTPVGEVDFYLASNGNIVNTWQTVDLSSLAGAQSLVFGMESSQDNPVYGMNTPAYVAVDNLITTSQSGVSNVSSATPSASLPPAAPTNLTATAGNGQVALTWNPSSGAASYDIYRGTSSGSETLLQSGITGTSFTNTGLTNGSTYFYEVTAVNTYGTSGFSNESSATLSPAAPANLAATASNGQVALTWNPSNGATSYDLYRGTSSGGETLYKTDLTSTSYTDIGVISGTTYFYEITAVNTGGQSGFSNEKSATLPAATPTDLTALAGNGQVVLRWNASSGAASYDIYRGTSSGSETLLQSGITGTSFTNTGLTNGSTYYYEVTAVNTGGQSGYSNEVSATPQVLPPGAPMNLTATASNGQIVLSWNGSIGATSYDIYRGASSGSEFLYQTVTGTSYTDTGVTSGSTYFYQLTAINAGGQSNDSNQASATLAPAAPTNLIAAAASGKVLLSWSASSGAASYDIYRDGDLYKTGLTSTSTSYTDSDVSNGTTYYYEVAAVNAGGSSGVSNQASATPQLLTLGPTGPNGLPNTAQGDSFFATLTPSGGSGGYTFAVTPSNAQSPFNALPSGIGFSDNNLAGQTLTTDSPGTYSFTITVTDSQGDQTSQFYSVTVGPHVAISGPPTLSVGTLGTAYPGTTFTASGGIGPYTYSEAGALPTGLMLDSATGLLSGTPTQYGTFALNIRVADSKAGTSTSVPYTLVINYNLGTSPNAVYVTNLYKLLLNRAPDPGASYWVNELNQGVAPAGVIQSIEGTTEYLDDLVTALYQHYLKRTPDAGGLANWVADLKNGATVEQVIDGIVSSPEFFQDAGKTNAGLVTAFYQDILNRGPDSAGKSAWLQALNSGASPAAVAMSFLTSAEYRTNLVASYYTTYLRRTPDAAGLNSWVQALQAGVSDQVVLASILGSAEGYADWK